MKARVSLPTIFRVTIDKEVPTRAKMARTLLGVFMGLVMAERI